MTDAPQGTPSVPPLPCRFCGSEATFVVQRQAGLVMVHCRTCLLYWTVPDRVATPPPSTPNR